MHLKDVQPRGEGGGNQWIFRAIYNSTLYNFVEGTFDFFPI